MTTTDFAGLQTLFIKFQNWYLQNIC